MKQHFKFSENPCICSSLSVNSEDLGRNVRGKNAVFTFLSNIKRTKKTISISLPATRCLHLFRFKAMKAYPPLVYEPKVSIICHGNEFTLYRRENSLY